MQPSHDIIVFGASGFTGRLAAIKLAENPGLNLAIAGRNRQKLEEVAELCRKRPTIIEADSDRAESIRAMVLQGRVIANFAGPFSIYGEVVIKACAELGRSYCDITGETPFVRDMIDRYDAKAKENGATLVPMAGFDSVPADVLAYVALEEAQRHGWQLTELKHYYRIKGGFNGGTLASVLTMAEQGRSRLQFDTNILIPDSRWGRDRGVDAMPRYEPALKRWSALFFMNFINAAVVRRSIYLRSPEKSERSQIAYSERMLLDKGRAGQAEAYLVTGGLGLIGALTRHAIGRRILKTIGPSSGQGPSEKDRQEGFYRGTLIAREGDRQRLEVKMKAKGDPGNVFTILSATTIARLLAEGKAEAKGFTTPTGAFGSILMDALEKQGVAISTDYSLPHGDC